MRDNGRDNGRQEFDDSPPPLASVSSVSLRASSIKRLAPASCPSRHLAYAFSITSTVCLPHSATCAEAAGDLGQPVAIEFGAFGEGSPN